MLVLKCMLVMSYNKVPKFSHYWSSNPSLGNVAIKNAISRNRCKMLLSKLYFAEPERPEISLPDFIVPLTKALMASRKLNARYQRRR
ncbi:piggyBac transposable element-derived protein 4 [Trichonephila clavata]|uniref:PiggyBac transposable element-derived protein 4 n=1 Tax=Trichonephila clavata TaxID=2740835 RepID=A0A8X6GGM4_TRICU|nr:piggyBac transposable element-derived protein 4 [Trichonephila clavata]